MLCKQGVSGSIPLSSTIIDWCRVEEISFEGKKVCAFGSFELNGACSAKIVKRRYVWRFPGVYGLRHERLDPWLLMSLMV